MGPSQPEDSTALWAISIIIILLYVLPRMYAFVLGPLLLLFSAYSLRPVAWSISLMLWVLSIFIMSSGWMSPKVVK